MAENAGGVHCLKYGLTVHNLLALKLLTIDGELLTLGGAGLDSAGYDLLAVVTGSEGLLGVIVEVTLKLLPMPETASTLLAVFNDIEQAGAAVAAIIGAGLLPAGLEMMDNLAIRAAEAFIHAGYPVDAAALVLCEMDGMACTGIRRLWRGRVTILFERAVRLMCIWRRAKQSVKSFGRDARRHFRQSGACRRIIIVWTVRFREGGWLKYCAVSRRYRKSLVSLWRMYFMPATAICIL